MQRFNAPLTAEGRKLARRINLVLLIAYSSVALMLATEVVAHIALKNPTVANTPIEATTKTAEIGVHS
jgi:hypothetical protein